MFSKATKDDPIVISSDDSIRSTKTKVAPKKKSKYIIIDFSDEEAVTIDGDVNTRGADIVPVAAKNLCPELRPTLKRKANELPTTHPTKKLVKVASKKGKQRASSHIQNEEDSASDSDFPDMLMTQGMYLHSTHDIV